ncbi:methyltransferase [Mycobacterium sp. 3519A]|uniref:methyltransferase n=1 Tax=Mycobacterium sp. 3519A TaxID=2057184 RepID=UPI000C7D461D|nr:methyltransferase [Mycobacterium sp. 3519A]
MIANDPSDPFEAMWTLLFDTRSRAALLHSAASLRLADHLAEGPRSAEHIAREEQLDPGATARLLRACESFGLVIADGQGGYSTTPMLDTLRSGEPHALRDAVLAQLGYAHWVSWGRLSEAVRTGRPQLGSVCGQEIFEYYASTEGAAEATAFNSFLSGFNAELCSQVAELVSTDGVRYAIDVGGANGSMVAALMAANPTLTGAVLDLAHVEADARRLAEEQGLTDRFDFIVGDFFAAVPTADLYLLKQVLHDWPDDKCDEILARIRAAAVPGTRLVIAEAVLDDEAITRFEIALDLTMLVLCGGRERTRSEFGELLSRNGFKVTAIAATTTQFSLIHAVAV